jgi:hypothetical protein
MQSSPLALLWIAFISKQLCQTKRAKPSIGVGAFETSGDVGCSVAIGDKRTCRRRAAHGRARAKNARSHSACRRWNCRHFSARVHRKDKDLAGINTIRISNLVLVRLVNDCVSHARAIGVTADAPEAVARGYDRGHCLGQDQGGR